MTPDCSDCPGCADPAYPCHLPEHTALQLAREAYSGIVWWMVTEIKARIHAPFPWADTFMYGDLAPSMAVVAGSVGDVLRSAEEEGFIATLPPIRTFTATTSLLPSGYADAPLTPPQSDE